MIFLDEWLAKVARELNCLGRQGALTQEWFTDGKWNKRSWLHARVWGTLVRSVQPPLVPMVEMAWARSFRPDLCIMDAHDHMIAMVEYESTNSSDERLMSKDIRNFEKAILRYVGYENHPDDPKWRLPEWRVVISSLPDCPVRRWPWWKGNHENPAYPPEVKDKARRDSNPLAYYEAGLHDYLKATWERIVKEFGHEPPCHLVWVNLRPEVLEVMNVNGEKPHETIRFQLELPG
jgi:hypothetical protein